MKRKLILNKFSMHPIFFSVLIGFASMSVFATDQQCLVVNCDCENIANHVWRAECRDYQSVLRKNCLANGGKPTGYCRLHGPKGNPVALDLKYSPVTLVTENRIEKLKQEVEGKEWSATSDLEGANVALGSKNYIAVLYALKHYEKTQSDIHSLRWQIAESLSALGRDDDAAKLWRKAIKKIAEKNEKYDFVKTQKEKAKAEWLLTQRAGMDKEQKKVLRSLAMRRLKNAGSHLERVADAHLRAGDAANAARNMQNAAELSELLLKWKVEADGRPVIVRYYRYQTAARWYSTANYWMKSDGLQPAKTALREAQRLINGTNVSAIADL